MERVERYINAVSEQLPQQLRDDVSKELRANIEDMLPENASDADVYQVLMQLGSPWKLAEEYNPQKHYLIGPGYYDSYLTTLKLVIGIGVTVFVGLALVAWVLDPSSVNPSTIVSDVISAVFEGAMQGTFWVSIAFILLERNKVSSEQMPFHKNPWTPDDLPALPSTQYKKISRFETLVSMIFTMLFASLIYFQPQLIGLYRMNQGSIVIAPLFVSTRLSIYMLAIFGLVVIELVVCIWKYIQGRYSIPLAIANACSNLLGCIVFVVMMRDQALWNMEFLQGVASYFHTTTTMVGVWMDRAKTVTIAIYVLIAFMDGVLSFYPVSDFSWWKRMMHQYEE